MSEINTDDPTGATRYLDVETLDRHRPTFGSPRVVAIHGERPTCQHKFVFIVKGKRVVICRQCRSIVDPFDTLKDLAHEYDWATHWEREVQTRSKAVDELKKEEQRIKARIRNARKKIVGVDVDGFVGEYLQKLNDAITWDDVHRAESWARELNLFSSEQRRLLNDARERAHVRAKQNTGTKRRVKVLKGGKGE